MKKYALPLMRCLGYNRWFIGTRTTGKMVKYLNE
jgi:hypothetical protein